MWKKFLSKIIMYNGARKPCKDYKNFYYFFVITIVFKFFL